MHPTSQNPQKNNRLKYAIGAAVVIAGTVAISSLFGDKDNVRPSNNFHSKKPLVSDPVKPSVTTSKPKENEPEEMASEPTTFSQRNFFFLRVQTPEKKTDPPKPKPLSRKELLLRLLQSQYIPESFDCEIIEGETVEKPKHNPSISDSINESNAFNALLSTDDDSYFQKKFEELVDTATVEKDLDTLIPALKYLLSLNILFEEEPGRLDSPAILYLSIAAKKKAGISGVDVDENCLLRNLNTLKQMGYLATGISDIFSTTGNSEEIFSQFPKEQHSLIVSMLLSNSIQQLSTDSGGFQKLFLSLSEENRKLMLQYLSFMHKAHPFANERENFIMNLINVTNNQELKNSLIEIMSDLPI